MQQQERISLALLFVINVSSMQTHDLCCQDADSGLLPVDKAIYYLRVICSQL
jgi:hypothetical protein